MSLTAPALLKLAAANLSSPCRSRPHHTTPHHTTTASWLFDPKTRRAGRQFDSNVESGQPFTFTLGAGDVIAGWDQQLVGICEGEEVDLILPPELAYGDSGAGGVIPGGATLKFHIKCLEIE